MELENGLPFKFYFENIDKFGRILPNNLSKDELDSYNGLCSKEYNWNSHVQNRKSNKLSNSFVHWIKNNNLLTNNINDDNVIYLCESFTPLEFYDNKFIDNISSEVFEKLKNNKLIVIFNWFAEPHFDKKINKDLESICFKHNLDTSNFFIFTSANNIKNDSKIHHISEHFFLKESAKSLKTFLENKIFKPNSFDYVCEIVNHNIYETKKQKHFLCLNRSSDRPHRYGFGLFVEKNNLWEKGIFSFLNCERKKESHELIEAISAENYKSLAEFNESFFSKIPVEVDTKFINKGFSKNNFSTSNIYYKPIYEQTAINIVTETTFTNNKVFLSEKTFHPILNLQPFIIFASNGQLQELKKLGFKTFGHVIDESYDLEKDSKKRFEMVCNEILRLSNLNIDEINDLFLSCKNICIHNRNHLLKFTKNDAFESGLQKIKKIKWSLQERKLL